MSIQVFQVKVVCTWNKLTIQLYEQFIKDYYNEKMYKMQYHVYSSLVQKWNYNYI
jgi:hypothetical protein